MFVLTDIDDRSQPYGILIEATVGSETRTLVNSVRSGILLFLLS